MPVRSKQFTCAWGDGCTIVLWTREPLAITPELSFVFDLLRKAYGRA
jgi:hypothetical protein